MKTVAVSEVDSKLDALVGSAQKERVVLTRAGKPSAILIGIESYDEEDIQLAGSADFWRLIESRRGGTSIPLSELKARLLQSSAPPAQKTGKVAAKSAHRRRGRQSRGRPS